MRTRLLIRRSGALLLGLMRVRRAMSHCPALHECRSKGLRCCQSPGKQEKPSRCGANVKGCASVIRPPKVVGVHDGRHWPGTKSVKRRRATCTSRVRSPEIDEGAADGNIGVSEDAQRSHPANSPRCVVFDRRGAGEDVMRCYCVWRCPAREALRCTTAGWARQRPPSQSSQHLPSAVSRRS